MKIPLIFLTVLFLFSCNHFKTSSQNANADFDVLKIKIIDNLWQIDPTWASSVGNHKFDNRLTIYDRKLRDAMNNYAAQSLQELQAVDVNKLSDSNKTDNEILLNQIGYLKWTYNELKEWEWNPAFYNIGAGYKDGTGLPEIINGSFDTVENRLRLVSQRLSSVAEFYATAKKQIHNPTLEHTDLAILQNRGAAEIFNDDLSKMIATSKLNEDEKQTLNQRVAAAKNTVLDYAQWLENTVKPTLANGNARSFRLGKELYDKKFEFELIAHGTAEEIYNKAIEHKKELHADMIKITRNLWSKYFQNETYPSDDLQAVRKMIDKISLDHVRVDDFQGAIEKQIPELEKFVEEKNLLTLDPTKPLVVRKEPAYMQGVAGASLNTPGPYDVNANSYYNVGSLAGYTPEEAESYLREYNKYILQILSIHEAIPGHYTQLAYSSKSPSLVKSIFGNAAMVEGWAVYAERMMVESGYGDNASEMWLMYDKWNLRSTINTILDYSVHVLNMPEATAMDLLVNQGFQQEAEAHEKWHRVMVTQVQLCSYFTGFSEIYDLRDEIKKKEGEHFSLKAFHEKFLSFGSAPVKYIRDLMLSEKLAVAD